MQICHERIPYGGQNIQISTQSARTIGVGFVLDRRTRKLPSLHPLEKEKTLANLFPIWYHNDTDEKKAAIIYMGKWNASTLSLTGVGEARRAALEKAEIRTLGDLVLDFPRAYQDRGTIVPIAQLGEWEEGKPAAILATVATEPQVRMIRRGMTLCKFRVFDESGTLEVTYFNMPYVRDTFHTGATFRFFGKYTRAPSGKMQAANPIYEPYAEDRALPSIVPVYSLPGGIRQKQMHQMTGEALRICGPEIAETLPPEILQKMALPSRTYMINTLHRPQSMADLERAKRRLVFEELFLQFLCMAQSGAGEAKPNPCVMADTDTSPLTALLPYPLTGAQKRSIAEIAADVSGAFRMNRILIGDVGSGKTVVAAAGAYLAVKNGYRAAILVPTEILASQHYADLSPLFAALGIRTALLTGSTPKKQRMEIYAGLTDDVLTLDGTGAVEVIIGTHALLTESVVIDRLGMVIIDEQHRFGVLERAAILDKGDGCHCLVMSATPIPRTLSLVAYGGLSRSILDEMPSGRQKVDTFLVDSGYHARLLGFIRKQKAEGHQTYVVCPAVEETAAEEKASADPDDLSNIPLSFEPEEEKPPLKAAVAYAQTLSEELPELSVAFVHGRMRPAEKDAVMQRFLSGDVDVLVSTTVIEVGVNVPNATLMIVENAERFGLSQLHQLRGRVGRGSAKSYFVMVTDSVQEASVERLKVIKKYTDGYAIAEMDLEMRGPGDFITGSGTRQHGEDRFRLAASCRDNVLIEETVRLAREVTDRDPMLSAMPAIRTQLDRLRLDEENTGN